jgi:hypothetical protein
MKKTEDETFWNSENTWKAMEHTYYSKRNYDHFLGFLLRWRYVYHQDSGVVMLGKTANVIHMQFK